MGMEIEYAYWAGVIDSDGWITMTKRNITTRNYPVYGVQMGIGQMYSLLPEEAKKCFNMGYLTKHILHGKMFYSWVASSDMAYKILKKIHPYLRLKKEQSKLCMEYREKITDHRGGYLGKSNPIDKDEQELRESYYIEVRKLNGRY